MNDMYICSQAGQPAAKRVQVNEPVTYLDQNNDRQNTTLTFNLNSTFGYNREGGITSMSYPSTERRPRPETASVTIIPTTACTG